MSFLNNIGKKMGSAAKSVGDAAKTATKKTEDMIEISKLNKSISTEQDKIQKICLELGKMVYEKFQNGGEVDPMLTDGCRQIVQIENNIASIKEKIEEIKKEDEHNSPDQVVNTIPQVQEVPQAAAGEPQIPLVEVPAPAQFIPQENDTQPEVQHDRKFCPTCGTKLNEGVKFCPTCGMKL